MECVETSPVWRSRKQSGEGSPHSIRSAIHPIDNRSKAAQLNLKGGVDNEEHEQERRGNKIAHACILRGCLISFGRRPEPGRRPQAGTACSYGQTCRRTDEFSLGGRVSARSDDG